MEGIEQAAQDDDAAAARRASVELGQASRRIRDARRPLAEETGSR